MAAHGIGVIEGFFGPEWSWESRHQFCESIRTAGGQYYIYAPKRDPYLRKNWMQDHPADFWQHLQNLSAKCREQKIHFGLGLSPFEIHSHWDAKSKQILKNKVQRLLDLDIKYLGLFFDDMKGAPDLADKQIEIVDFVKNLSDRTLLFCPTYYSDDRILDKVFGERSPDYLEKIGKNIALDVEILWTGSKVISPSISSEELVSTAKILKRKPFLWDNCFANDGPRQCKFLRLRSTAGRSRDAFDASAGWAFNLMNQPSLSEVLFKSSTGVLLRNDEPRVAFEDALEKMVGSDLQRLILQNEKNFNEIGLDAMDLSIQEGLRSQLNAKSRFAKDILDWLDGKYIVGPECLTD